VAFLENNFDISFHTPQVPLEIIGSQRLLMLSGDQFKKCYIGKHLVKGKNVIVVESLDGAEQLTHELRRVLSDPAYLEHLASNARTLSEVLCPVALQRQQRLCNPMLQAIEHFFDERAAPDEGRLRVASS
jgi:hypothetical protein